METVLLVVHLIVAIALIGVLLLQRSEGEALGIGGGGGGGGNYLSDRKSNRTNAASGGRYVERLRQKQYSSLSGGGKRRA
jgi:protein translocase SecG subunit